MPDPRAETIRPTEVKPSPEAQMRMYAAILGREPQIDPHAPPLPQTLVDLDGLPVSQLAQRRTWRQLVDHAVTATDIAARRLREARRRVSQRRDAA